MGGRYRAARLDDKDLRQLGMLDSAQALRDDGQRLRLDTWADQGYWLLLPLLLLAACAGRRGWLFCLPLLLMGVPQPSYAFGLQDLWLRPDQQGQYLLKHKRPAEAAEHFRTHSGKAWRCTKPAITPRPSSGLPKAATPIPTTTVAMLWPRPVSLKRPLMRMNKPWKPSPICNRH